MKKSTILISFLILCFVSLSLNTIAQSKNDKSKGKDKEKEEKVEKKDGKSDKKDTKSDKKDTKKVAEKKDTILGNKIFVVDMTNMDTKKGEKNKIDDVIEFKNNKLKSKFFEGEGFPAAVYTVALDSTNTEEKEYIFTAESKNEGDGMILKWEGSWDGENFSGNVSKTKKDKPKGSFEFKGYEKSKKK